MIIYDDIKQRSEEWFALRVGRITGTRIKDLVSGKPATVENLCLKIAAERLTGVSSDKPFTTTPAMQHGIDTETEARREYELATLNNVIEVGFCSLGDLFGVSPDGLIRDRGMVEIKCPQPNTHLGYLLKNGTAWKSHEHQIQGSLWVTGYEWCDFVSYHPDFPVDKKLLIEHVVRDEDYMSELVAKADKAEKRINEIIEAVK